MGWESPQFGLFQRAGVFQAKEELHLDLKAVRRARRIAFSGAGLRSITAIGFPSAEMHNCISGAEDFGLTRDRTPTKAGEQLSAPSKEVRSPDTR